MAVTFIYFDKDNVDSIVGAGIVSSLFRKAKVNVGFSQVRENDVAYFIGVQPDNLINWAKHCSVLQYYDYANFNEEKIQAEFNKYQLTVLYDKCVYFDNDFSLAENITMNMLNIDYDEVSPWIKKIGDYTRGEVVKENFYWVLGLFSMLPNPEKTAIFYEKFYRPKKDDNKLFASLREKGETIEMYLDNVSKQWI